eukprot:12879855-Alexandrium_andersonii.AAC.1
MEALEAGEAPPVTWDQYKTRINRRKRWIDGIAILAATEVLERKVVVISWSWKHREWQCSASFEPRKDKERKRAGTFPTIAIVL